MVSIGIPKPGGSHFPHIKIAILGLYNIFRHTNLNIFKDVLNRASCLEKKREESDGATKLPPHLDKEFGCLCVCLEIGVYPPKWHFNGR
jgi:hypothetical protein